MRRHGWLKPHQRHYHGSNDPQQSIALSEMNAGQAGVVISFQGGRMVRNRLASLGFTPGVQISMIQNYGHGPLIVSLRGTRVALGRGEAARIFVRQEIDA